MKSKLFLPLLLLGCAALHAGFSSFSPISGEDQNLRFAGKEAVRVVDNEVFLVGLQSYYENQTQFQDVILFHSTDHGATFVTTAVLGTMVAHDDTLPVLEYANDRLFIFYQDAYAESIDHGATFTDHLWSEHELVSAHIHAVDNGLSILGMNGRTLAAGDLQNWCDCMETVNGDLAYASGLTIGEGPWHANSDFNIKNVGGWPVFHGPVTTASNIIPYGGAPDPSLVFLAGYVEETYPLQYHDGGLVENTQWISEPDDPTVDIVYMKVLGDHFTTMFGDIQTSEQDFTVYTNYPPFGPVGDSIGVNHVTCADTVWTAGPTLAIPDFPIGIPCDLWIEGEISGNLTVVSQGDAYITGNITYTGTIVGEPPDGVLNGQDVYPYNPTDFFTLFSQKRILLRYGMYDPYLGVRRHTNADQDGVYLYGQFIAVSDGDSSYDDGIFSFEYQHPHRSTPNCNCDGQLYTHIDLHLCKFPPEPGTYWPASIDSTYQYPSSYLTGPDYPWYNPLWPEYNPYFERGIIHIFGSRFTNRVGFIHRSAYDPMDQGYWDPDNHFYGPNCTGQGMNAPGASGSGIGYSLQNHYDSRLAGQEWPGYFTTVADAEETWLSPMLLNNGSQNPSPLTDFYNGETPRSLRLDGNGNRLVALVDQKLVRSDDAGAHWITHDLDYVTGSNPDLCVADSTYLLNFLENGIVAQCWKWDGSSLCFALDQSFAGDFITGSICYGSQPIMVTSSNDGSVEFRTRQDGCFYSVIDWTPQADFLSNFVVSVSPTDSLVFVSVLNGRIYLAHGNLPEQVSNHDLSPTRPPFAMSLYPNPFNPRLQVDFSILQSGPVKIDAYDLRGRKVAALTDQTYDAGAHSLVWEGKDDRGRNLASGVYLLRVKAVGNESVKRVMLLK
jgi:hypothetical protein